MTLDNGATDSRNWFENPPPYRFGRCGSRVISKLMKITSAYCCPPFQKTHTLPRLPPQQQTLSAGLFQPQKQASTFIGGLDNTKHNIPFAIPFAWKRPVESIFGRWADSESLVSFPKILTFLPRDGRVIGATLEDSAHLNGVHYCLRESFSMS